MSSSRARHSVYARFRLRRSAPCTLSDRYRQRLGGYSKPKEPPTVEPTFDLNEASPFSQRRPRPENPPLENLPNFFRDFLERGSSALEVSRSAAYARAPNSIYSSLRRVRCPSVVLSPPLMWYSNL